MAVAQDQRLQSSYKMDGAIERPQSALSRGVQITEFNDSRVNPEPIVLEETDLLLEQFLSPRKLMMLTGVDNLDDIKHLEMKVNTSDTSLGNFGQFLQYLTQLKVSNSTIPRIRDLGSSLRNLQVLWSSRCGLEELDGISSMCNLRELYLSYNEISDISPVSMLDQLEILDLEGNNLDDIVQVQYLAICSKLQNLTLEGNPLCTAPNTDSEESLEYDYRQAVKKAIPHLKTLDDEVLIEGVGSFQKHNVFDADWAYLEELQKDMSLQDDNEDVVSDSSRPTSGNRPSTASLRPNTGYRPGSAMRPSSGFRPMTAGRRPNSTGQRPATALGTRPGSGSGRPGSSDSDQVKVQGDNSELTLGRVICGNPSKALLSRRRLNPDAAGELDNGEQEIKFEPKFHHKVEHTYDTLPEEERDRSEIIDELRLWKQQHEQRMEVIRASKAPQVLRIDHDEAADVIMSGDSDVDSDTELSPLRDSDKEYISHVHIENNRRQQDEDPNCKILPSVSSFVPVSPTEGLETSPIPSVLQNKPKDSSKNNTFQRNNYNDTSVLKDNEKDAEEDSLLRASSENTFKISQFSNRQKASIPPPSQRDVVRKNIDTTSQAKANMPLGSLYSHGPTVPVGRPDSRGSMKVNSTGLPRPPTSGLPSNSVLRRDDQDHRSPVIMPGSGDRPPVSMSQRPSTARAALGIAGQPRMRRSLPTVPSLPSKPPMPPAK